MKLFDLLSKKPNIVINTDIDGVLSGLLLVKYCGCKIVGFTNSRDKVWLDDDHNDLFANVYVDMFVTDPRAICIDQHIVAIDKAHIESIKGQKRLLSPQHEDNNNLRFFDSYGFKNKYPFGTFQFIISMLESEGVKIQLPDLYKPIPNSDIKVGDLLNRPDDAMKTTLYAYAKNASNWWNWLENKSPNGSIQQLKEYLDNLAAVSDAKVNAILLPGGKKHSKKKYESQREEDVATIKDRTKDYFKNNFQCTTNDGDFKNVTDSTGMLLSNIKKYIITIASIIGLNDIELPNHLIVHQGKYYRTCWLDIFPRDFFDNYILNGHQVFSYAFIFSPSNDGQPNFSFTVDLK